MIKIPCPVCCGDGFFSPGDRHVENLKEVCQRCKGAGEVDPETGQRPETSSGAGTGAGLYAARFGSAAPSPPAGTGDVEKLRALSEKVVAAFNSWSNRDKADTSAERHLAIAWEAAERRFCQSSAEYVRSQVLHPTAPGGSTGDTDASPALTANGEPDADRLLKEALFACLKSDCETRGYGGVRVEGDRFARIKFWKEDPHSESSPPPAVRPTPEGLDHEAVARLVYKANPVFSSLSHKDPIPWKDLVGVHRDRAYEAADAIITLRPTPTGDGDAVEAIGYANVYVQDDGKFHVGSCDLNETGAEARECSAEDFTDTYQGVFALVPADRAALAASKAQGGTETVEALAEGVREVVRRAWILLDNTVNGGELEQYVDSDDWSRLSSAVFELEALIPASEKPCSIGHVVTILMRSLDTTPASATNVGVV